MVIMVLALMTPRAAASLFFTSYLFFLESQPLRYVSLYFCSLLPPTLEYDDNYFM